MKYENTRKVYLYKFKGETRRVRTYNAETCRRHPRQLSWSHGFTHFEDADTGEALSWCGIIWFEDNAQEVKPTKVLIPASCRGEKCSMCGQQAYHKVEETLFDDDPTAFKEVGIMGKVMCRHPFTAYLCRRCFAKVMRLKNKIQ